MQLTMQDKYMTLRAAADYVGCSVRTIERWSERGYIKRLKGVIQTNTYAYSLFDVDCWEPDIRSKRKHGSAS